MNKLVVTGGAGFIGSALLWALNERGRSDIIVVDELDHQEKENNIGPLRYEELVGIDEFQEKLRAGEYDSRGIEAILHLGAISATTEKSWERLEQRNVGYSQDIIRWCVDRGARCIYASSGQTYGFGEQGYSDDHQLFDQLKTITLYGKSKLLVDIWARDAGYLDQVAGLRYFNVFGPNENHKEGMRSVVAKQYEVIKAKGFIELFKSDDANYADGEQQRDFVYIKDAVAATLFFLDNPGANGVYNIGTGTASSWNQLARAMFAALQLPPDIRYVDMPPELNGKYQYFTQADITKLRAAGFKQEFMPLAESVEDYIVNYLEPNKHLGESNERST